MDLEQFRRAYMQAEGLGNTPGKYAKRFINLTKSAVDVLFAIGKDRSEKKEKAENLKMAWKDIRSNGISVKSAKEVIQNRPTVGKHTSMAVDRFAGSAYGMERSINEARSSGKVGESTVAASRSNSYNGQDLEIGINYFLKAMDTARKGIRISASMKNGLELGVIKGLSIVEHRKEAREEARDFGFGREDRYKEELER